MEAGGEFPIRGPADGDGEKGSLTRSRVVEGVGGTGDGEVEDPVDHVIEVVGVEAAEGLHVIFDAFLDEISGQGEKIVGNSPSASMLGESRGSTFDRDIAVTCQFELGLLSPDGNIAGWNHKGGVPGEGTSY